MLFLTKKISQFLFLAVENILVKKNVKDIFLSMWDVNIFFWHLRHRIWYYFDNYFTYFVPVFK